MEGGGRKILKFSEVINKNNLHLSHITVLYM